MKQFIQTAVLVTGMVSAIPAALANPSEYEGKKNFVVASDPRNLTKQHSIETTVVYDRGGSELEVNVMLPIVTETPTNVEVKFVPCDLDDVPYQTNVKSDVSKVKDSEHTFAVATVCGGKSVRVEGKITTREETGYGYGLKEDIDIRYYLLEDAASDDGSIVTKKRLIGGFQHQISGYWGRN